MLRMTGGRLRRHTIVAGEKSLQNYLLLQAVKHGVYARKVAAQGHVGFPDVFLAKGGQVVLVELKSPTEKGRLSKKQERESERIRDHGVPVWVVATQEGVDAIIASFNR